MLISGIIGASLAILSLIYWPLAPVPFEIPKVFFFTLMVELLVIVAIRHLWKNTTGTFSLPVKISWALVLWAGIASVVGVDQHKSLIGNYYRWDGWVTLSYLVMWAMLLQVLPLKKYKSFIPWGIALGAIMTAIWSFTEKRAGFGIPQFVVGYLVVSLPFIWYALRDTWWLRWFAAGLVIIAVILLGEWGGYVGLVAFAGMGIGARLKAKQRWVWGALIAITVLGLIGFRLFLDRQTDTAYESRERMMRRMVMAMKVRPLAGWGVANIDYAIQSQVWPYPVLLDIYVAKAHSTLMEWWVTTGVIGLSLYIILVILTSQQLIRLGRKDRQWAWCLLTTLVIYLVHSQTNITSIAEETLFWLVVGLSSVT